MKKLSGRVLAAFLVLFAFAHFSCPVSRAALSRPTVEKDPAAEAVTEWESVYFTARADGAEDYAWRFVSADGSTLYTADAAPNYFPGLRIEGQGTDTLTLLDVPSSLDGWSVQCLFTDSDGGKALSARAQLTVYAVGPTETPEVTPSPEISETPTPAPTETPSPVPAVEAEGTPEPTPSPEPTATPAPAHSAPISRRAVLGIFAALVALALILGAVSLSLRGGAHSSRQRRGRR